jgi:glycosyltransferase involved in cell wall biosynthesis
MSASALRVLMITSEWASDPRHTAHFIARQVRFLRAAGVDVDVFAFRGGRRPLRYLAAWAQLQRRLMSGRGKGGQRYDLVHAQFGQSGLLALPKRLPLVVTFRGDDLFGILGRDGRPTPAGRLLQWLSRRVARRADAAILVSEHLKQYLSDSGASIPRVHIVPSGLDLELFRPIPREEARRHLGWPPDGRRVLFVGDPGDPRKRYDLARQAVELVNCTIGAELVIGWRVPHDDMPFYMSACDALVFTSREEGSPNAVKEALACDLPVVSVAVADVPLRLQGIPGCEVTADDSPPTIAAALERTLRRDARSEGRGREAASELDERLLTGRVIDIYRSVLARTNGHHTPELAHV